MKIKFNNEYKETVCDSFTNNMYAHVSYLVLEDMRLFQGIVKKCQFADILKDLFETTFYSVANNVVRRIETSIYALIIMDNLRDKYED